MSTNPLIRIRDLQVSFGSADALHPLNLNIRKGRITAVVGESGSGKSVTALSILGLLPRDTTISGSILFEDEGREAVELRELNEKAWRKIRGNRIAMIFQEPMTSLNPLMRCGDQVAEVLQEHKGIARKEARKETVRLFQEVQLPDPELIFRKYPHEISGGQKQRVMIAMAMSCEPALLIADEPTTALDVTVQQNIIDLMRALQRRKGMAVLFITHDLGLVSDMADDIVVLYKGRIVETGETETVLSQPQHPYTQALLACRPILYRPGQRLPQVADFLNGLPTEINRAPAAQPTGQGKGQTLVEVKDLCVWYPGKRAFWGPSPFNKAVDGVSFTIATGETLGVVGESGCGKTTLGRALLRLGPVPSGEVLFEGEDLYKLSEKQLRSRRRDMQLIFQDPYSSLNPRRTIGSMLKEVLDVHQIGRSGKERIAITVDLLEKVGLNSDHLRRYPHEFSGGQRQRIGIARALALHPRFLVCDESVSALDVSVQAQVLNLLNDLKKEYGFTIFFISHDISVVQYISDRIMVMQAGRIVESGLSADVFHQPAHPYTQKLMAALPGKRFRH